jgi:hypothetical protein
MSTPSAEWEFVFEDAEAKVRHGWREDRETSALAPQDRLAVGAAAEDVAAVEPQTRRRDLRGFDLVYGSLRGSVRVEQSA